MILIAASCVFFVINPFSFLAFSLIDLTFLSLLFAFFDLCFVVVVFLHTCLQALPVDRTLSDPPRLQPRCPICMRGGTRQTQKEKRDARWNEGRKEG